MKKNFYLLILVLLFNSQLFAQARTYAESRPGLDYQRMGNYYLERSRSEKAAALIFLVAGFLMALRGAISIALGRPRNKGILIFCLGAGLSMGSIPLFMTSEKSRQKSEFLLRTAMPLPSGKMDSLMQVPAGLAISWNQKEKK